MDQDNADKIIKTYLISVVTKMIRLGSNDQTNWFDFEFIFELILLS